MSVVIDDNEAFFRFFLSFVCLLLYVLFLVCEKSGQGKMGVKRDFGVTGRFCGFRLNKC